LVDFYFVRHGHYAITSVFDPRGIYGRWSWRGLVAYTVGFAAMIPFFATSFYTGPAAHALGGADLSFAVGLVIAGGLYLVLSRSLDRQAEEQAVAASLAALEDGDGSLMAPAEV